MKKVRKKKRICSRNSNQISNVASVYPTSFYKYQSIDSKDCYAIDNLFKHRMLFSSRLNLNDPFDSNIKIINPTLEELDDLLNVSSTATIEDRRKFLCDAQKKINRLIDEYKFYCLSERADINLMWSYYANGHKGLCIEFTSNFLVNLNKDNLNPEKVTYEEKLPSVQLVDFLGTDQDRERFSIRIWKALRTKLVEWDHEKEYRIQLSKHAIPIEILSGGKGAIIAYEPCSIKSVIFGYRMCPEIIDYIKTNMPYKVQYQKAVPNDGIIEIHPL